MSAIAPGDLHLADASDADDLARVLDRGRVGRVVYSAGGLLPADSEDDPDLDAKLTLGPLHGVLEALRERPGISLTYISSGGTVYGEPDELPVDESAPARPHGSYGELHLRCEAEIERHRREHGLRARILRCSTVYGEQQRPDRGQGVIPTFLHRIEHRRRVELYGEETVRDYVYAGDVAGVVADLVDRDDGETVLNVGSGEGTSLGDLLRLLERQVGRRALVEKHPARDFDVRRIVLDTSRLRSLIRFEPTPLATGIERTRRWLASRTAERV